MKVIDFILWLRHLLCPEKDTFIQSGEGEVFLRCMNCGLRSPGMATGDGKYRSKLEGDPARHRLNKARPVVPKTPAEVDVAVEVFEIVERTVPLSGRTH